MAAINVADISIDANGNIRWTGAAMTNRHSVLEFIQLMMDLQDDEQAAGNDLLDITVDTPFNRSTDQIVTLNSPFNIDDTFALHLYDGSVSQTDPTFGGETLYSGLNIIGPVETGTEYMVLQNGKVLPSFWGTGINPEAAPSLVFSRHLVRSKFAGSQVDGQRITVLARELGDQYRRFPVTLGTGNSVAAIGNGADIFNTTIDATIAGWTTITNVEGFQELDLDGTGAAGQEFYSQWNVGSQTVNETYERSKWISQRSHVADLTAGAPTGTDFVVDNAVIVGQAQSFIPLTGGEHLTEIRVNVKVLAGVPTGTMYCELWDSDDAGSQLDEPTGGELAVSERVLVSHFGKLGDAYEEVVFRFNTTNPIDGTDQKPGLALDNAMYFAVFRHLEGTAGANLSVEGAATDQDATQNQADDTAAVWTASATDDIGITVKSSPEIHGIPGEIFQGINVDVGFDGEVGAGIAENSTVLWGTILTYDGLSGGPFFAGEEVTIRNDAGNAIKSGGHILFDDATDKLVIALDTPGAAVIDDNDIIEGLISGATAAINVAGGAIADEDKSGGTGIILAKDDNGAAGEVYLQVLTGANPVDNNVIRESDIIGDPLADLALATATIVTRTVSPEYLGTSTGSNIIGAYGVGFEVLDVAFPDRFTDLSNTSRPAENSVVFTVSALVSGEDRVLVGPRSGTSLDRGQWLVATLLDAIAETVLVVKTGTDTVPFPDAEENWPNSGAGLDNSRLRIQRDDGIYTRTPYDSHDGADTFTLAVVLTGAIDIDVDEPSGEFRRVSAGSFLTDGFEQGCTFTGGAFANGGNNAQFTAVSVTATVIVVIDNAGMVTESGSGDETLTSDGWSFLASQAGIDIASINNDAFMAFIDVLANAVTETFTGVHSTNRDLFVRVRDGGGTPIKTFESVTAQFLSTPQTVAAIRTDDF